MPQTIITRFRPVTVNTKKNTGRKKHALKVHFQSIYCAKYHPAAGTVAYPKPQSLYSNVVHFHRNDHVDVDNIVKYIQDSFTGLIFDDDNQIHYVATQEIDCSHNTLQLVNTKGMSMEDFTVLVNFLCDNTAKNLLYYECGKMTERFIQFDLENLWS